VELVSTVEIARMFDITRQRVDKLSRRADFPEPVASLAIGRVWDRSDIVRWAQEDGRSLSENDDDQPGSEVN
jgi:prophage regulatory protein